MPATPKVTKRSKTQVTSSSSGHPDTPPDSPTTTLPNPLEFAKQVIDAIKLVQTSKSTSDETSPSSGPQAEGNTKPVEARARASRLEFRAVDEVYVP